MFKLSEQIVNFYSRVMDKWRVELKIEQTLAEVFSPRDRKIHDRLYYSL